MMNPFHLEPRASGFRSNFNGISAILDRDLQEEMDAALRKAPRGGGRRGSGDPDGEGGVLHRNFDIFGNRKSRILMPNCFSNGAGTWSPCFRPWIVPVASCSLCCRATFSFAGHSGRIEPVFRKNPDLVDPRAKQGQFIRDPCESPCRTRARHTKGLFHHSGWCRTEAHKVPCSSIGNGLPCKNQEVSMQLTQDAGRPTPLSPPSPPCNVVLQAQICECEFSSGVRLPFRQGQTPV